MAGETTPRNGEPHAVTGGGRRILRSSGGTSGRGRWIFAASLTAAVTVVAILGYSVDTSTLAGLPSELAAARDVSYGSGGHQRLDLVYERTRSRLRPAIVMIHQGGWMQGDKSSYHRWMIQYAHQGYVTVSINFRPSGVARFPAAIRDCKLAVRWLRAHAPTYGVDGTRIGVTGWSSGAHLAMLLALSDDEFEKSDEYPGVSSRVQSAVCISGVYDLLMEERGHFPNAEDDAAVVRFLGRTPRQNPELARRASPLTYLSKDDPPLLVFHGELDRRIDAEQARQLALASRALGRTDEVILLPGAGHGRDVLPDDPQSRQFVQGFFARHLRPGE